MHNRFHQRQVVASPLQARLRVWLGLIALAAMLAFGVSPALAQSDSVTATLIPLQTTLTVGDIVPMNLQVVHPAGWRVIVPELEQQWGDFEVRSQGLPDIQANEDGTETTTQRIDVTLFAPGTFETPPLSIRLVNSTGQIVPHEVAPVSLTVNSVLQEGDDALRDIKPQAALDVPYTSPLVYVAVGLVGALALAAVVIYIGRRLKNRPVPDLRTPYQKARDELVRVETLGLLDQGRVQEHYQLVSDTLRQLFEQVYHFPCTDLTTVEIRRWFNHMDLPLDVNRYAIDVLKECDLVKYSNALPDPRDAANLTARAQQVIFMVEPVPSAGQPGRRERVA